MRQKYTWSYQPKQKENVILGAIASLLIIIGLFIFLWLTA